ncbi:MAG: hypothetical protein E6J79_00310 [Deltaproteobacteria bacterium]|nr:MAG: hypothetical protein E6J79_00310 [Deltaproteobacteria bacterium]
MDGEPPVGDVSRLLWLCFGLSGAAALGLELLWMRSAGLVLGSTAATASTVLACYFAGLGLGAAMARTTSAGAVRRYAFLELGAAGGALWSLLVFRVLQHVLATSAPGVRTLAVITAVLPATICLGATLPALGQALAPPGQVGRRGGLLYAVNIAGGALGVAAMGFGLPVLIGVTASYLVAAATSAAAGLLALLVGVRPMQEAPEAARVASGRPRVRLRLVAAASGALGLGLEVLWIRLFAQVLHNSVYSFAAVSLVFLVALALGAGLAAILLGRISPAALAAFALVGAAGATVGGFWSFVRLTGQLGYVGMNTGLVEYLVRIVGLAAATAGPGAIASGAVLPALWAAFGGRGGAARPLGELTAANTIGAVAGALTAGYAVLPAMGLRGGMVLAAAAYLVLADVVAPSERRPRALAWAALLAIVLFDPLRAPLAHLAPAETLRRSAEGASGIVTVVDTGDDRQLRLDNFYVLGGSAAARNERRQGLLPLLLHPAPRRVAFIGMATGITASAGLALGVPETTVVELVPEVARLAAAEFGPWNGGLLERPGVHLVVADGRRYLAATATRYDVVVGDLFIPWHAGAGSLYAREMFETVARHLAPGGLFCQWLPLYQLTREEFAVIARTFLAAFPSVTLWRDDFYPDRPVLALVGRETSPTLDVERVRVRLGSLPDWSEDPLLKTPRALAMLYLGNLTAVPEVLGTGPINTDDRPVIEFLAPRLTRMTAAGDKDWFTAESLDAFTEELAARPPSAPDAVLPADETLADARRAGRALYRYALAARQGDEPAAARFEAEVRRLVPEVVAAGERETPVAALADARRTLGALHDEQERLRRQLETMEKRLGEILPSSGAAP